MSLTIKVIIFFAIAIAAMVYFIFPSNSEGTKAAGVAANEAFIKLASLPGEISESSGLAVTKAGEYITHNDAGNKPYLYRINRQAQLEQTIKLNLPNVDWEDLATDDEGNIYIADTGNNNNKRKELAVYKISLANTNQPAAIRFTYEDQTEYPPSKKDRNFDCEAIFWHGGTIYLISKDRGRGATAKVYTLPDAPGTYRAKLLTAHKLKAQVTGAAISPNSKTVALLSEGKLHLFSGYGAVAKFYEGKYKEVRLKDAGQTEGLAFEDDRTLIITSEGGNLYRYSL